MTGGGGLGRARGPDFTGNCTSNFGHFAFRKLSHFVVSGTSAGQATGYHLPLREYPPPGWRG